MKRVLAFILTAFLLFGAIPATFLNAFAVGPGVSSNGITNQSINDAANQYIPESVVIDGNVNNDTAWASHKWNEVNTNNGTWDKENPSESSKSLTYKYQLSYDYEYFYGAFVVDVLDCEVTVWLKDGTNDQGGYSHKLVYTVANGAVTEESFLDYAENGPKTPSLAVQQDIKAVKKDGNSTIIEFRRYLNAFTDPKKASDMQYFVSVKIGNDSLYFPRIRGVGDLANFEPSAVYWPVAVEGTNHLVHQADSDTLSPIIIDGKFDEAAWSGLTNFHQTADKDNISNITFDDVHFSDTYQPSANSESDKFLYQQYADGSSRGSMTGDLLGVLNSNDSLGRGEVKFKYVYRTDGEYFYCAIVAEVPKLKYEGYSVEGEGNVVSHIVSRPTLTIYFYNQTYNAYYENKTKATNLMSQYNGWVPEHMIAINTRDADSATNVNAFVNISARVTSKGAIDGMFWSPLPGDDTENQSTAQKDTGCLSAYAKQGEYTDETGEQFSVWYFENRVKLDAVKSSGGKADDLYFSISLSDRPWVNAIDSGAFKGGYKYYSDLAKNEFVVAKNYYRNSAWTGTHNTDIDSNGSYAFYYYKNGIQLKDSEFKGDFVDDIVIDSNLDKQNLAALVGADSRIDGIDRIVNDKTQLNTTNNKYGKFNTGGYNNPSESNTLGIIPSKYKNGHYMFDTYQGIQYTYNIFADHEYAYFAIALKNLQHGDGFRLWVKSPDSTTAGYESAVAFSYDENQAQKIHASSWYRAGGGNELSNHSDYKIGYTIDTAKNLVYAEIRIALSELGIVPNLNPVENQVLFTYYITAEDYGKHGNQTASDNNGLVHPRCNVGFPTQWDALHAGRVFYRDKFDSTKLASGTRAFDHSDSVMLDYIKIDGKLDEEIWDEASDRVLVQGNNGQWTAVKDGEWDRTYSHPGRNDVFEYSYKIYVGDNYIYGAVELNQEAVLATDGNYASGFGKFTSIQLWLNNIGTNDAWGDYANKNEYDNYYYNIFLCDKFFRSRDTAIEGPSGLVYGGSTPSVNLDCYRWNMSVLNGKTYAEFMISTKSYNLEDGNKSDRFVMSEEHGAEFFISVKHPTEQEKLTLTHPAPAEMFYLTHYEDIFAEGAGNIYTNFNNTDKTDEYLDSKGRWWTHVMLVPDTATGGWKVVATKDGTRTFKDGETAAQKASDGAQYEYHYGFLPSEIAANPGCIIYCVNTGNNYMKVMEDLKSSFEKIVAEKGYDINNATQRQQAMEEATNIGGGIAQYLSHEKNAEQHLNFVSSQAELMRSTIFSWKKGDIIKIPGLVSGKDVKTQVEALLKKQNDAQIAVELPRYVKTSSTKQSFVDPTKTYDAYSRTTEIAKPKYYESGFRNIITYELVTANNSWGEKLPTKSYWYGSNTGKLEKLEHISPEKITVDGVLNDTGWAENGWITVDEDINATTQLDSAEKFILKYQIRNDGKYLYVAAVFDGVAYDATNAPMFTLWTKDDGDANWSKYYRVGWNNNAKSWALNATIPELVDSDNRYLSENIKYTNLEFKENGKLSVLYNNYIDVVKNNDPSKAENDSGKDLSLGYHDSNFYGYTDKVEEYTKGYWYPDIQIETREYIFGKEAAVMTRDNNTQINGIGNLNDTSTILEFRVALDEIDASNDGFEYFVTATRKGSNNTEYTMHYPNVYCQPESEFSYYNLNLPFWKWYDNTSAKVTAEDLYGDMYLCNEYAPVVTLGAKFNDNFDGNGSNAIRFGGYYSENMIRRQEGLKDGEYDQNCDYWHVYDLGIIFQFTQLLDMNGNEVDLTLDTDNVGKGSSVGIVNWVQDSNFADYECYAFYVTLNGVPENYKNVKFTARTYVDYYDFARESTYYGQTIERSINMISENAQSSENVNLPK